MGSLLYFRGSSHLRMLRNVSNSLARSPNTSAGSSGSVVYDARNMDRVEGQVEKIGIVTLDHRCRLLTEGRGQITFFRAGLIVAIDGLVVMPLALGIVKVVPYVVTSFTT
jgi:hypothetical protein